MFKIILFCLLLSINFQVFAAVECLYLQKEPCDFHTETYLNYKHNKSAVATDMFLPLTYGGYLNVNSCLTFNPSDYREYISLLGNISCSGSLCTNGTFGSLLDVEYIIDLKYSILSNCSHNIYGNIVLTNHIWAQEMKYKSWKIIQEEKKHVYGKIFNRATEHIKKCHHDDAQSHKISDKVVILITFLSIFVCCLVVLVVFIVVGAIIYQHNAAQVEYQPIEQMHSMPPSPGYTYAQS